MVQTMISKKLILFLLIIILVNIFPFLSLAQSPYFGFNRNHFEQLLTTKSCPGCQLYYAKLSNIDLTGANLRGAYLIGASLRSATLRSANLSGARIGGANFSGADLTGAIWTTGKTCQQGSIGICKTQ